MNPANRPPLYYEAYGLSVRSDIPLSFISLPVHRAGEPDVTVRVGATPVALSSPIVKRRNMEVSPGAFLRLVKGVARYLVRNGEDICVEICGESDRNLSLFLTGPVFAAVLQQRGILTLHASTIMIETGAILFAGDSGVGKSTLLGAFLQRGYTMMADDVTGVTWDAAGRPVALSAFPSIKLWTDTLQNLGWQGWNGGGVRPGLEKKYEILEDRFVPTPSAVHAVCVLDVHDRDDIEVRPLKAAEGHPLLWKSIYRRGIAFGLGKLPEFFLAITALVRQVPIVHVARPAHPFRLNEMVDRIEEYFRKEDGGTVLRESED